MNPGRSRHAALRTSPLSCDTVRVSQDVSCGKWTPWRPSRRMLASPRLKRAMFRLGPRWSALARCSVQHWRRVRRALSQPPFKTTTTRQGFVHEVHGVWLIGAMFRVHVANALPPTWPKGARGDPAKRLGGYRARVTVSVLPRVPPLHRLPRQRDVTRPMAPESASSVPALSGHHLRLQRSVTSCVAREGGHGVLLQVSPTIGSTQPSWPITPSLLTGRPGPRSKGAFSWRCVRGRSNSTETGRL